VEDRWDSESPGIYAYTFKLNRRKYRSDLLEEFSFTRGYYQIPAIHSYPELLI
jgi:hypothetical protein